MRTATAADRQAAAENCRKLGGDENKGKGGICILFSANKGMKGER